MRKIIVILLVAAVALVWQAPAANAGLFKKAAEIGSGVYQYAQSTGTGIIETVGWGVSQLGALPADNPGIAIENHNTITVTGPPVIAQVTPSYPYTPYPGVAPFVSSAPTGAAFADPVSGCGGSLGFSGWINAGAYTVVDNDDVRVMIPFQVTPGTSRAAVEAAAKSMKFGTAILDAGFNITAELECNTSAAWIPTLSEWGLIALTLLLFIAAIIVFRRRHGAVPA